MTGDGSDPDRGTNPARMVTVPGLAAREENLRLDVVGGSTICTRRGSPERMATEEVVVAEPDWVGGRNGAVEEEEEQEAPEEVAV